MEPLWNNPAFRAYAASLIALFLNTGLLAGLTAAARSRTRTTVNQEDKALLKAEEVVEHPDVSRVLRAHRNLTENAWIYVGIAFCYVVSGASGNAMMIYAGVYVLARFAHTIFYTAAMQPWRTVSFGVSQLVLLGMVVQLGMALFR